MRSRGRVIEVVDIVLRELSFPPDGRGIANDVRPRDGIVGRGEVA